MQPQPAPLSAGQTQPQPAQPFAMQQLAGQALAVQPLAVAQPSGPPQSPPTVSAPLPSMSGVSTLPSSMSIPVAPPLLDAEVDRLFEAERHFRRGNRALERERWSEALTAFEQAIALCPNEGEFVAYVGWARHCTAPEAREATERALASSTVRSCSLRIFFVVNLLRARVLNHAGKAGDALKAFHRVLVLEPSSEEARVAIQRLSPTMRNM